MPKSLCLFVFNALCNSKKEKLVLRCLLVIVKTDRDKRDGNVKVMSGKWSGSFQATQMY